jgi:diguanylate cyclase (GGDEF)-like protein/PAS domain S-box-containing protein
MAEPLRVPPYRICRPGTEAMTQPAPSFLLHAILVEDSEDDSLLLVEQLDRSGFKVRWERVENAAELETALDRGHWDIVFSDYTMPHFRGDQALAITRRHDPDLPFIFVSGTIGEEAAVACMKAGAQDYVMKHDLNRLGPAVRRELEDARVRRERHLAEQELRKLSLAVEQTAESVFITDLRGRIEYANPAFESLYGYSAGEALGQTPSLVKSDRYSSEYFQHMWGVLLSGETFRDTLVNRRKDGSLFYEEKTITPLAENGHGITHFVSTGHDVTERVRGEEARSRLVSILEATTDFVATTDSEARLLYLNQAGRRLLGLGPQHDIGGMPLTDCLSEWGAQQLLRVALPAAARDGVWEGESALRGEPDRDISVSQVVLAHRDGSGELAFYSTVARDISERKQYEEELRHQATHDMLTGLPNRTLLDDRLKAEINRAIRQEQHFALIFLDLDNFKRINDSLGHPAGDKLLREVSARLQACLRPNDTVARYGGDEFVVVGGDLGSVETVLVGGNKLRNAFETPMRLGDREIYTSFSAGIALYPGDGLDAEMLLKNADTAMYRAKDDGQGQFRFYASDMNARSQELLDMESGLRRALERGEFQIYYQPQLDLRSGRVIGSEALLRWARPGSDKLIGPVEFVPLLEETGLILPVGEWVLRNACAQWSAYRSARGDAQRIAVNVSARQFSDRGLVDMVARVLKEENMRPDALEIEITESTVMQDPHLAGSTLVALAALGVRLAVDDFGTGYSSLAYLKRFPLDTLKIDATFIRNLPLDGNDCSITEASISLGHKLGLEVLAEGVENSEQYEFLRAHDCDLIQGYYVSPPMPAESALPFVARGDG